MKITNFPQFVVTWVLILTSCTLISQETKQATILYNTKPVLAEITKDATIIQIVKDDPEYLSGFVLQVPDYVKHLEDLSYSKGNKLQDLNSTPIVQNEVNSQSLTIPFEAGFAILTDQAIAELDNAIKLIKNQPNGKLTIRTFSKSNNSNLDQNRINSIKSYFQIRGLNPDLIKYEALKGNSDLNEVKIALSLQ